jgi:hypothetical protein
MSAAKFLVPAAVLIGVAFAVGGAGAKKKNGKKQNGNGYVPVPDETPRPESDRMLFDDGCNDLIVRVRAPDYDLRITERYWQLRNEGVDDPQSLAVGVLQMDAPQCMWPPGPDSSLRSKSIWELVYPAVEIFWGHEKAGTLDQFAPVFGTAEGYIE